MPDAPSPAAKEGVTPPTQQTPSNTPGKTERMSEERSREILRQAGNPSAMQGADPLLNSGEGKDPLEHDEEELDPLFNIDANGETIEGAETPAAEAEAVEETPGETTAEEQESTEEADAPEEETETTPPKDGRKRLQITRKNPDTGEYLLPARDRAILQIMAEDGCSIEEATRKLSPEPVPKEEAAPAAKLRTVAEIDAEIVEMRKQRDQSGDDIDTSKMAKLLNQIEDLRDERDQARQRDIEAANAQTQQRTAFERSVDESADVSMKMYPDAGKVGTPLHKAIAAEVQQLQKSGSPLLQSAEWPELLTAKHAARLGLTPVKATTAPQPKLAVVPPKRPATPTPAPGSVVGRPATNRVQQIEKEMAQAYAARDTETLGKLTREAVAISK